MIGHNFTETQKSLNQDERFNPIMKLETILKRFYEMLVQYVFPQALS